MTVDKYYILYKDKVLAGPLPHEDAEMKCIKLGYCFKNVEVVPEDAVKAKPDEEESAMRDELEAGSLQLSAAACWK
ncbi:hypothetical protein ACFFK0_19025 [Paenibacillus chartarius]|uniref:Uncharacterized protein n=1 Tax=Paenibacillus chartarius TaxID=747481 RepID=A0ABV6DPG5_9BACL